MPALLLVTYNCILIYIFLLFLLLLFLKFPATNKMEWCQCDENEDQIFEVRVTGNADC